MLDALKTRVLTAAVLLAVFLLCLFYLPAPLWTGLVLLALAAGAREWAAFAAYAPPLRWVYVALSVALMSGLMWAGRELGLLPFILAGLFWVLLAPLWLVQRWQVKNPWLMAATGWLVLLPFMLAMLQLRARPWLLLALLAVVWVADSAAYFAGRRFGRHKLAPAISPGKTWEGVAGAMLAVALCGAVLFAASPLPARLFGAGISGFALFAATLWLLTGFSIVGDLFESWMKRRVGLKDSGKLLPGHGGLLDRIDALTATLPLAALALIIADELAP